MSEIFSALKHFQNYFSLSCTWVSSISFCETLKEPGSQELVWFDIRNFWEYYNSASCGSVCTAWQCFQRERTLYHSRTKLRTSWFSHKHFGMVRVHTYLKQIIGGYKNYHGIELALSLRGSRSEEITTFGEHGRTEVGRETIGGLWPRKVQGLQEPP